MSGSIVQQHVGKPYLVLDFTMFKFSALVLTVLAAFLEPGRVPHEAVGAPG